MNIDDIINNIEKGKKSDFILSEDNNIISENINENGIAFKKSYIYVEIHGS